MTLRREHHRGLSDAPGQVDFVQGVDQCNAASVCIIVPGSYRSDLDGDVGIVDFLGLLAQWGSPGSCDFDGGGVGINDFLELLGNWGPCP